MKTKSCRLAVGQWIVFDDEQHQVTRLKAGVVHLRSESGTPQMIAITELLADPTFQASGPLPEQPTRPTVDSTAILDGMPDGEKDRVLDMEAHLLEATTGYRRGDADQPLPGEPRPQFDPGLPRTTRLDAKAAELGLTRRRLFQLLDAWNAQGLWGLVDKRKARLSNPLAGIDSRVIQAIRDQYAAEIHDSAGTIGSRFLRRVRNRLTTEYGPDTVSMPAQRTFYRVVHLVLDRPPSGPTATKRSAANQPSRPFGHLRARRAGELVLMDTTRLDLLAYDPGVDDHVGVELTVALDLATRSLLSWRLTAEGTKGIDVGLLLADALVPEPMRPHWRDALRYSMLRVPYERVLEADARLADAAARPVIYPETIIIDHGKQYQCDVLDRACQRLGISIADARKFKPTDKPQVEAVFRTIRFDFSEHVAGYKGYDVAHRGRDVEKVARWTIEELEELFAEYVIAVYQRRHHDGLIVPGFPDLRRSPNEAYSDAVDLAGFVTCPTDPTLYYELLPIAWRTIQPYGVEIDKLVYWGDVLQTYRKAKSPHTGQHAGKWPVRHDPRNRLHAYFHNPADGTWHVLRWVHALDEHLPFTDTTLREAKRLLAIRGIKPDDQDDVAAALLELQNRTDAPESWTRTDRKRLARDAERARAAARDRYNAAPTHGDQRSTSTPALSVVPDPTDPGDEVLNLDDLPPFETWNPHAGQREN